MKQVIKLVTLKWNKQRHIEFVKTERLSDKKEMNIKQKIPREGGVGKLVNAATYDCLLAKLSCKWVYKMLGPEFIQACLYFYWHWVQKLIVKTLDTLWVKWLDMPDGIVLYQCKTCTKVKAVLVPVPPCLIFRAASQPWCQPIIWFPGFKGTSLTTIRQECREWGIDGRGNGS